MQPFVITATLSMSQVRFLDPTPCTAFGPKAPVLFTLVLVTGAKPKKSNKCIFHPWVCGSHVSSLYTARIAGLRTELPPVTHAHFHVHGYSMLCTGASFQQLSAHAYF